MIYARASLSNGGGWGGVQAKAWVSNEDLKPRLVFHTRNRVSNYVFKEGFQESSNNR